MLRPMRSFPSLDASVGVRLLTLVVALTLLAVDVTQAQAVVSAPGFSSGPKVVSDGLLWAGFNSAGQEDVFLSTETGTRVLVPDAELSAVNVDDGWVVVAEASGPKVGRVGRGLRPVQGLHRCLPIRGGYKEGERLEAPTNGNLYAVVRATCLGRLPRYAQFLVRVQLGTGNLHVVGRVPSGAISLAAAGSRLALTYKTGARPTDESPAGNRVRVEVLDARNGRLLYRLAPPQGQRGRNPETQLVDRGRYRETQLDAKGDVLVISGFGLAPSSGFGSGPIPSEAFGWWGVPRMRVGRPLEAESTFGASLSEGRIAYATSREVERSVYVLNLRTSKTRTIVAFSGSVRVGGFGVGKTGLAWAQQNYAYTIKPEHPPLLACVTEAPIGSPELIETPLSTVAPPIVIKATPGSRPAGLLCEPPL
jgi:hypothetical protein